MLKLLRATAFLVALLTGCGPRSDQASTTIQRVKRAGVMRVGFEGAYPPFNFLNEQKQFDGFDVDVANDIARRLSVKVEFVATQFEALIGGLDADKWDIVIAQMSITDQRKKQVDFTDPYVVTGGVIIVRNDESGYTTLADLKGKRVGAGAARRSRKWPQGRAPRSRCTSP